MRMFVKIRKVHIIALLVFIIYSFALVGVVRAVAGTAEPGSEQNPLVAKDYVDDSIGKIAAKADNLTTENTQLNDSITRMNGTVTQLMGQVEELKKQVADLTAKKDELEKKVEELSGHPDSSTGSTAVSALKDIKIPAGKQFIGGENTEFILISGKASVVSASGSGLLNESTGAFAVKGTAIVKNSVMLVIKADGRGFKAVKECRVLVRGTYTVK